MSSSADNHVQQRAYHVQAVLGSGGFGAVYRAKYVGEGNFSKMVALKVLHAGMAAVDEVAMRMRDEARMLGLISHRNIVQVDRLVQLNGRWTIVMEYVDGVDLKTISHAEPMPIGPALEVVSEVASALHQAFNFVPMDDSIPEEQRRPLEILHRDIKPANIQITRHGEVKVLDFGIARGNFDAREAKTQELFFGSPEYTAPERYDLEESPAGDVYSLGCVLYEALMGKAYGRTSARPAQHDDLIHERLNLLDQMVLNGQAQDILELLASMLAYEPTSRPSAREVERQCARLRVRYGEPLLREWTEQTLPPLLDARQEQPPDDLTGSTLYEQITSSQPMPSPSTGRRTPPRRRKAPIIGDTGEEQPPAAAPQPELLDQLAERASGEPAPVVQDGASSEPARDDEAGPPAQAEPAAPPKPSEVPTKELPVEHDEEEATDPGPTKGDTTPEVRILEVEEEDAGLTSRFTIDQPRPTPNVAPPTAPAHPAPAPRDGEAEPAPQPQPPPQRTRPAWVFPVAGVGALAMFAAVVVALMSRPGDPTAAPQQPGSGNTTVGATTPEQPGPGTADAGRAADPVVVEATNPVVEEVRPTTAQVGTTIKEATPIPRVEQRPQSPPPTPQPLPIEEDIAPAGTSMVQVQGQDLKVILKGAGGTYEVPGWVHPGTYEITAEFPGFGRKSSGNITVVAGAATTINCDAAFGSCKQL